MRINPSNKKPKFLFAGIFVLAGCVTAYSTLLAKQNRSVATTKICSYTGVSFGFYAKECREEELSSLGTNTGQTTPTLSFILAGWDGEPATSLYLASGEKSVVAGQGRVMAMGILETGGGQTAPDGMPVDFYSDGILFARGVTKGGVAYVLLDAPTRAGAIEIMAKAENINTSTNFIRVVPGDPVALKVNRLASSNVTMSENEVWVKTDELADQYGNGLTDGTFIQFTGKDQSDHVLLLNAVSINGIASARLLNRNVTESVKLKSRHKNVVGEQTSLAFHTIQLDELLNVKIADSIGQLEVTIGPVLRKTGGFVPDGTLFKLTSHNGQQYNAITTDGYAVFRITHDRKNSESHLNIEANGSGWNVYFREENDNEIQVLASKVDS